MLFAQRKDKIGQFYIMKCFCTSKCVLLIIDNILKDLFTEKNKIVSYFNIDHS